MQFHMLIKGLYHFLTLIYVLYIQEFQRYLKAFYHVIQIKVHSFFDYIVFTCMED